LGQTLFRGCKVISIELHGAASEQETEKSHKPQQARGAWRDEMEGKCDNY
jgi:hypothetical protein